MPPRIIESPWIQKIVNSAVWSSQCSNIKVIPLGKAERIMQELLTEKDKEREEAVAKYQELLMAVEFKHEGETRHQTALRYIQQTELPHLIGVTAYQSELDQPNK